MLQTAVGENVVRREEECGKLLPLLLQCQSKMSLSIFCPELLTQKELCEKNRITVLRVYIFSERSISPLFRTLLESLIGFCHFSSFSVVLHTNDCDKDSIHLVNRLACKRMVDVAQ